MFYAFIMYIVNVVHALYQVLVNIFIFRRDEIVLLHKLNEYSYNYNSAFHWHLEYFISISAGFLSNNSKEQENLIFKLFKLKYAWREQSRRLTIIDWWMQKSGSKCWRSAFIQSLCFVLCVMFCTILNI